MGRIWVNIVALLKRHEEHTVWNGFVDGEGILIVVSAEKGGERK